MRLNLGCGRRHLEGWVNVDRERPADLLTDLDGQTWPFSDSCAEAIRMSHVLEHLSEPEVALFESHRILRPGGRLEVLVPHWRSHGSRYLGHRTYWDEQSLRPVLEEDPSNSQFRPMFQDVGSHIHYLWPAVAPLHPLDFLKWHFPSWEWERIPLGPPWEVHFLLEAIG